MYACVHVSVCTCVCTHVYVYAYVCMCVCVCVSVHVHVWKREEVEVCEYTRVAVKFPVRHTIVWDFILAATPFCLLVHLHRHVFESLYFFYNGLGKGVLRIIQYSSL